jgi:hypothetical protein
MGLVAKQRRDGPAEATVAAPRAGGHPLPLLCGAPGRLRLRRGAAQRGGGGDGDSGAAEDAACGGGGREDVPASGQRSG